MLKQFYFWQFSLAYVICLHSVLMSNSSIWPTDRILPGAATPGQSGPGINDNEGGPSHSQKLQDYGSLTVV